MELSEEFICVCDEGSTPPLFYLANIRSYDHNVYVKGLRIGGQGNPEHISLFDRNLKDQFLAYRLETPFAQSFLQNYLGDQAKLADAELLDLFIEISEFIGEDYEDHGDSFID